MSGFESGMVAGYQACIEDVRDMKGRDSNEVIERLEANLVDIVDAMDADGR